MHVICKFTNGLRRLLLLGVAVGTCAATAQPLFRGKYEYGDTISGSAPGSAMVSTVTFELEASGRCIVEHSGFQVYERFRCKAKMTGRSLKIFHVETIEDDSLSGTFNPGDLLFSATEVASRGGLHVTWAGLHPSSASEASSEMSPAH